MGKSLLTLLLFALSFFIASIADGQKKKKDNSDYDGDGVPDKEDACPYIRGLNTKYYRGCPDADGDLVIDQDDRCPLVSGPANGKYPGCPEEPVTKPLVDPVTPKEPEPEKEIIKWDQYGPIPPADWKARIDKFRDVFYADWDKAITESDKISALKSFGDKVRNRAYVQTAGGLEFAIEPVIKKLGSGNPVLARTMVTAWYQQTGLPESYVIRLLPLTDQNAIKKLDSLELIAKSPAKVPITTVPTKTIKTDEKNLTPCEKEIQALTYKKGNWVLGENRTAIIFDYSCDKQAYVIAWMDKSGKLQFMQDMSVAYLNSNYRSAANYEAHKFSVCKDCAGLGYHWVNDKGVTFIGTLRIEFDRKDLVKRSCMYCSGNGCHKFS